MNIELTKSVSSEEIREAVFGIKNNKFSRADGMTGLFFFFFRHDGLVLLVPLDIVGDLVIKWFRKILLAENILEIGGFPVAYIYIYIAVTDTMTQTS